MAKLAQKGQKVKIVKEDESPALKHKDKDKRKKEKSRNKENDEL